MKAAAVIDEPNDPKGMDGGVPFALIGGITAGAGVAALATGGVFTFLQSQATGQVNDFDKSGAPGSGRQRINELKDEANGHYSTSLAMYGVGGALVAVGVGLIVVDAVTGSGEEEDAQSGLGVGIGILPGGGAVSFGGTF